jgi:hypothetical protein
LLVIIASTVYFAGSRTYIQVSAKTAPETAATSRKPRYRSAPGTGGAFRCMPTGSSRAAPIDSTAAPVNARGMGWISWTR